jgi:UDP-N-acetylmuramate dehydrogenase
MNITPAVNILGERAQVDAPVGPLTTYRVGGRAALLFEVHTPDDLVLAARAVEAGRLPVLVVGRGSNMLVSDRGFPGLALVMGSGFDHIEIGNPDGGNPDSDGVTVRAGGATALPALARRTAAAGLTGLEWAVGVPGSVGGAVRMNAGGHGSDVAATLCRAGVADLTKGGAVGERAVADLDLAYRHSAITPEQVVVWAEFGLGPGDRAAAEAEIREIVRWRREHQPGGANAGSVFTNPDGDSAGRLIEAAGLRGHRLGSAYVSPKHANFFQADEGGSADDVAALIGEVQRQVEATTGVRLHPELRMIGFER